ncbi:hypothetical protein D9758_009055 [Tetrapyrgos nigripes]|uniref:Uncharacterized protein n=1 Tax=Tetrapyrgos nigripes TaxID=182062 RepID=A0A8H5LL48_9AGAR|nr:hypothetical protein D9758_009055 [Tetrapyrgos nigripes]
MAAASAVVPNVVVSPSHSAGIHSPASTTSSTRILPNPNPTNIHQALAADTISAIDNDLSQNTTGSGSRIRRGSVHQSNPSLRGDFYANRLSRGSMASAGSGASSHRSLGFGESEPAYGDSTGTKGWGTGNNFERSTRVNTVYGVYGSSTGTKGWGTGNSFESLGNKSNRGSNVSIHSGGPNTVPQAHRTAASRSQNVPADAVSTTSRKSTSANLRNKVKDVVASTFKKSGDSSA